MSENGTLIWSAELVAPETLMPHRLNYRVHPEDQRRHLVASIAEHGVYRNVVVARDGTILAGHGVVEAALEAGVAALPVVRLDLDADDPRALKILTGDNEVTRLAEVDDRALSELLREIKEHDLTGLLGTGFDDAMLANLVYVTRPEGELARLSDAAAWVGLPGMGDDTEGVRLNLLFETVADRDACVELLEIETFGRKERGTWSAWWPPRGKEDMQAIRFAHDEAAS